MESDPELRTEGLRDFLATNPHFILVVDHSGVVRYVNQLREGVERGRAMGFPARDLVHPDSRRVFDALLECTQETGEPQERVILFGDEKGWSSPFLSQTFPLRRNGTVESMVVLARKVAEGAKEGSMVGATQEVRERCAWCGRIQIGSDEWKETDPCPEEKAGISFTHGLCPDCYDLQLRDILDASHPPG